MSLAPVALFVFNRPHHTRKTLEALVANPEFSKSPLYVFCDGPRGEADLPAVSAVRRVVREFGVTHASMVEALRRRGKLGNSWALRWYWSVFKQNGLVLFPHATLVRHFGDDDSGTNVRGRQRSLDVGFSEQNEVLSLPSQIAVDERFYTAVRSTIARQQSLWSRGWRFARRFAPTTGASRTA